MKIRLTGTKTELKYMEYKLREAFGDCVREVSAPYANSGDSKLSRVYIDIDCPGEYEGIRLTRAEYKLSQLQEKLKEMGIVSIARKVENFSFLLIQGAPRNFGDVHITYEMQPDEGYFLCSSDAESMDIYGDFDLDQIVGIVQKMFSEVANE